MLGPALALASRELRRSLRQPGEIGTWLAFFVLALALFPLGVGAAPELLARIGAGCVWVLALLAVLLSLERMWQPDLEDGSLDLILASPAPLELLVLAKAAAHWLTGGLVLALVSPLLVVTLAMPTEALWLVPLALLLGTPTLTLIGQIAAALLLGTRRGSVLAGLLVLPLEIPVLVFGVSAIESGTGGLGAGPSLLILAALLLLAVALAPIATAAALRLALE